MQAQDLRNKFLQYFKSQNHTIIPSASLIPDNDPTVLFTTAAMHPLVPYLIGEKHPQGRRLASVQRCVRTGDIDEVGDTTHHTFFEMLGNWSLGDYDKIQAINFAWEFLTKILNIKAGNLSIGSDADIAVINLDKPWVVEKEKIKSKSKNTAIEKRKMQGKVEKTFINGNLVFEA